jgi:hypothetical protein
MKRIFTIVAALMLAFGGVFGISAAANAAPSGTHTICMQGNLMIPRSWDGKDPKTCRGKYQIYKDGKVVLGVNNLNMNVRWDIMKKSYRDAQNWCASNSLTCAIVTSAGVSILIGLL